MLWSFPIFTDGRSGGHCALWIQSEKYDCFQHVPLYCASFSAFRQLFVTFFFKTLDAKGCAAR